VEDRKCQVDGRNDANDPERTFLDLYQPRRAAFHELLAVEPMLKRRSMKRQDHEPVSSGPEKPRKPSRTEEARRIVEEYANDLREILEKLRKLSN
jgi:sugar (pentulose or hexulose) kinase